MIYIFDFDGTLVDSMDAYCQTMINVLDENNINYSDDIIKIITPLGYKGTAEYFRKIGIKKSAEELIARMHELATNEYTYNIPAKADVKETLTELKARGHSLNVLTASPHAMLDVCLKRTGLYDLFDNVWSCDDFNMTKSEPQIYIEAAARLGVTVKDCVFLDDNVNAVAAAKESGMNVIGVYDKSSEEYADRMREIAPQYVITFRELL